MTVKIFLVIIMVVLLGACNSEPATDSPEKVKEVLVGYFKGIENTDFEKMFNVTTNDFVLFENGQVWNNDSLINYIKSVKNMKAVFAFDDFKITMGNSIANMSYVNRGSFVIDDTLTQEIIWIESATFVKQEGVWKMDFLHSTIKK
ncbi:nuclear transport factor 2 family protein [Plebeiibacterium marinum]|uniref:Nuclear transport factor 2 family protein n=1 Tax=Plebeiibacterium marinum TaxID=2992111 RepID=A0AAE3SL97_9BACT|nr:nuclear transport factor 2 family protein [Plebeiobacterium marinum]MCW3807665.1 nuclear transport factor 2 family protein [Plebeiobacterium marinum]